jgi:hypothetical protein
MCGGTTTVLPLPDFVRVDPALAAMRDGTGHVDNLAAWPNIITPQFDLLH